METANIDKLDYHLSKFSEFDVVDGCKPPCHTNTIVSTKLRVIKQDTNDLNIMLDPTVTTYNTMKSSDWFKVMLETGSSMGLWIIFSILQIFDVLVDTLVKTFQFLKMYNKKMLFTYDTNLPNFIFWMAEAISIRGSDRQTGRPAG